MRLPSSVEQVARVLRGIWAHPLGSRRRAAATLDFVRWQLASRVLGGAWVMDFVDDARLLVRGGMTGATGSLYVGLHEFEDMAFAIHLLRPGDLFVDVGANVGSYTVLASKVAGARSISFEPLAGTHAALLDNLRLNDIQERVRVIRAAVGSEAGTVTMTAGLDTTNHVVLGPAPAGCVEVPLVTLDGVLEGAAPTLLKVDVEGFEDQALAGASRALRDEGLLAAIIELNDAGRRYGHELEAVHALMLRSGFDLHAYEPFSRRLLRLPARDPNRCNGLYVRRTQLAAVERRLREAPAFRVKGISV